jgi:hypothetical protein
VRGKFYYMTFEDARTPRDNVTVYTDRWWGVVPGKGLLMYKLTPKSPAIHPQCNRNKLIADRIVKDYEKELGQKLEVQHFDVVYLGPWDDEWGLTRIPLHEIGDSNE